MTGCGPASLEVRPWEPRSLRVGDWLVTALSDGAMRLDGGGMWGVVPKNLWGRLTPPAQDNTIAIALRPQLAGGSPRGSPPWLLPPRMVLGTCLLDGGRSRLDSPRVGNRLN